MNLKAFLKGLGEDDARAGFADRCETSLGHLRNICYGKPCSPKLAVSIERESGGIVTRPELLPDSWHRIWPELIDTPGAPPVPATQEAA